MTRTEVTILYLITDELGLDMAPMLDDYLYDGICIDSVDFEAIIARIEGKFHIALDSFDGSLRTMTIRDIVNRVESLTH